MPKEVEVGVRARRDNEDVIHWVQEVLAPALGSDHHQRSPRCVRTKMEYAKIPVQKDQPIGAPVRRPD